jgi:hypothetical protein
MLENKTTQPQPIYRKDYEPSAYLIHTTELHFQKWFLDDSYLPRSYNLCNKFCSLKPCNST